MAPTSENGGGSPILEKGGQNVATPVKSRVKGIAQKCKCGSVWCPQCFPQKHASAHMDRLRKFKHDHTREIVLTVDPSEFENGEAALEYIRAHRAIPNLVRDIERGAKVQNDKGDWEWLYKPLPINDWIWFLEWHKGGYPHFHLFIETRAKGKAGMIGGDRIRHYWKAGKWAYESYIKSEKHLKRLTGYFRGHGYFEVKGKHSKLKDHQVTLPKWAQENYGSGKRIRRVGAKCTRKEVKNREEFFDRIARTIEVIDTRTGEILMPRKKTERSTRSYKAILKSCGQQTRVKLLSDDSYLVALIGKPYKEIREKIPGVYEEGQGYAFCVDLKTFHWLMDNALQIEVFESSKKGRNSLKEALDCWHEIRIAQGYYEYKKHYA